MEVAPAMFVSMVLWSVLFSLLFPVTHASQGPGLAEFSHVIRVRIEKDVPEVVVSGLDLQTSGRMQKGRSFLRMRCEGGRIEVRSEGLAFRNKRPSPLVIQTPAGFMQVDGRPVRNEIQVIATSLGRCHVVNNLDLEKYLEGLVNSEFSSSWSQSAVEAQVIAARSYALYQMREAARTKREFDVEGTIHDQVYEGAHREDRLAAIAVQKTRGMVLIQPRGKIPVKAFYHSTCGGKTEATENVWGKKYPGVGRRVSCPYCFESPRYQWSQNLNGHEIQNRLKTSLRERPGLGRETPWLKDLVQAELQEIKVHSQDQGRVRSLEIQYRISPDSLVSRTIPATVFRGWMGVTDFRSTAFQVQSKPDAATSKRFLFVGRGNGHGVGLCQYGAKKMGELGRKFRDILGHYYPDARLEKLW